MQSEFQKDISLYIYKMLSESKRNIRTRISSFDLESNNDLLTLKLAPGLFSFLLANLAYSSMHPILRNTTLAS